MLDCCAAVERVCVQMVVGVELETEDLKLVVIGPGDLQFVALETRNLQSLELESEDLQVEAAAALGNGEL